MLKFATLSIAALLLANSAFAAPLDKASVADNAKWVLHLDVDALRKTKTGGFLVNDIVEKKWSAAKEKMKLNLSLSVTNLASITIYGTRFSPPGEKEGVLLIKTSADLKKDVDAVMGLTALADSGPKVTRIQETPYLLYKVNEDAFFALDVSNTVVVAKSRQEVENAADVLLNKKENLSKNERFGKLASVTGDGGFFFLGAVQGLADAPVPPNAQVLKETDGGSLILGENATNLFADLILQGKTDEATAKIQQIFQGLIALASLNNDNKDLSTLANGAKVSADGQQVRVRIQYPVAKVIAKIEEKQKDF